jgi:hypothetical protein
MASNGTSYIPDFIKISQMAKNLKWKTNRETDTHKHTQKSVYMRTHTYSDVIHLLRFFEKGK